MPAMVTVAPRVTVPAVPSNTAKPCFQAELLLPSDTVQLVVLLSQVPLPPVTVLVAVVVGPSQNSKRLEPLTTRLTLPVTDVWMLKAPLVTPAGTVPIVM